MAKIVVIGAGLTGLSAAYHLEQKGFHDYKIFEKESCVGGLCRSVNQDGFTFDYTGHLIHINNHHFEHFIKNTVNLDNLNKIIRRSFIYSQNKYVPYPFQVNLHGLKTETIIECIEGFIKRKKSTKGPKTFYQWVLKNFGAGFGKNFFFPYQTKIFDYDIRKISSSWTNRFVPATSLRKILMGSLTKEPEKLVGYNSKFLYPKKGGISFLISKISKEIKNKINTNFCLKMIDQKNKLAIFDNGHIEKFDSLISTIPLNILINKLKEKSSTYLKPAAKKLLCNSIVNFNIGTSKPKLSSKHWIYFPESKFPFYRIGFTSNFSDNMAPENCSSLYGELSYTNKSKQLVMQNLKDSIKETKKLLNISENEVLTEKIIHIPHAYIIYNFWREKNLKKVHKCLNYNSVYSIGRYGHWKYSSMQEAFLDGKDIVDQLLTIPAKKLQKVLVANKINYKVKEIEQ